MTENVSKMCFIVNFKVPKRHPHRYIHRNREYSYARALGMAKYVISTAVILNVS